MSKQSNNQILLSICIPTYNRARFLVELLNSIIQPLNKASLKQVEIVISDNSQSNDTEVAIEKISAASEVHISYYKNSSNVGADKNIVLAVERAKGKYCWLLGDDDLVVTDAIARILKQIELNQGIDVFMGDKEDIYIKPSNIMKSKQILNLKKEKIFDFKKEDIEEYFRVSKKLIGFFNFISVLVVKKESWSKVEGKEIFIGSDCNHMYIILSILFSGDHGVLKYIPDKIVKRRWGTDRIPDVEKRIRLDVGWIHKIAKKVFNNPKHVRGVDARLIKNDGFSWAVRTKISTGKSFYFNTFPFLFGYFWSYPLFWIKIVPLLFMPNFILKIMRGSYRKMIKGEPLSVQEVLDG